VAIFFLGGKLWTCFMTVTKVMLESFLLCQETKKQSCSGSPNPAGALPLDGARLMALLTTRSGSDGPSKEDKTRTTVAGPPQSSMECPRSSHGNTPEVSVPPPAIAPAMQPVNLVLSSSSSTFSSNMLPKGRSLRGEHVVYDVDVRRSGEAQPQLEVCPLTVFWFPAVLQMGRQIAVNRRYLCYVLQGNKIEICSVDSLRGNHLLRGGNILITNVDSFYGGNCSPQRLSSHTQV
jgi:enhancer of mRNA-decapping protein 4